MHFIGSCLILQDYNEFSLEEIFGVVSSLAIYIKPLLNNST